MPLTNDHINYVYNKAFNEGQSRFLLLGNALSKTATTNDVISPAPLLELAINTSEVILNIVSDGVEFSITKSITVDTSGVRAWAIANLDSAINVLFYYDNYDRTYDLKAGTTVTVSGKHYY